MSNLSSLSPDAISDRQPTPKILIVDDQVANLFALERALVQVDAEIFKAQSGQEALALLLRHEFALVLMDVQMPEMNGFETATLMRDNEATRYLPIIFVTAMNQDESYIFKGYEAGAVDYLLKPINAVILRSKVNVFLQLYLQQKALGVMAELQRAQAEIRKLNAHLERRVAERTAELQNANQELEAFSYSVSHDLRAPLRAIEGYSKIIQEEFGSELPEEGRRLLNTVRACTQGMDQLIRDLLEFSRLSRAPMKLFEVDLGYLVRAVWEDIRALDPTRLVETRFGELPIVQGDSSLLRQLIFNLLANAFKYSRTRNPAVIEVGVLPHESGPVFYVKDNGVGFDMRYVDKLFGVFQRLHRAEQFEGTGVGLAIVQRIARRHGGRVWAEGEPEKGATFFFTLRTSDVISAER